MLRELIFGPHFFYKKQILKKTEFYDKIRLKKFQEKILKNQLLYSVKNIPYYKKYQKYYNEILNQESYETIKKFPIIDKEWIRNRLPSLVIGSKIRRLKGTTGGTTGQPFVFYLDRFYT